jgi:type I restriction-modification system DNA methylase subunit
MATTSVPKQVIDLVELFDRNRDAYVSGSYNEAQLRREFIDPFFEALGWDVENRQGSAIPYRDVIFEDSLKVGGATKAPDYSFRIGGQRKFFVEAKKPSVNIAFDSGPAFQLRRYAWSAKLPLSILTNFEEFAVYSRSRPVMTDKASTARIKLLRYREYPDRWDELYSVFSPEAIRKGSFDKYVLDTKVRKGTAEVDDAFLEEIERWRDSLARNIALRNPRLGTPDNTADLNFAVQQTIDRLIFLRICEDRGIEDYGVLQNLIGKPGVYRRLMDQFQDADKRYNSGLFDFRKDTVTPTLKIDDKLLSDILSELYPPKSPYEFSVIGIEILGEVYEQFLGKVIRLTPGHQAKVEEKPEVKKAGGVHYTPQFIVNYLVKNTIGRLIEGKTPEQISKLAFLDKSCGSGSFAIGGYSYLLDYHLDWYTKHDPAKRPNEVFAIRPGEYLLTTAEKKRILLNNIYGVDIDPQAVEVTKLSLLLKVLEHENKETINQTLRLFRERALPNLDSNIKCGNSLIDSDFYRGQQASLFDADIRRVNAFDWHKAFPEVMTRGGFDADIGNPPYIRVQALNEWAPLEVEYYKQRYQSASKGNYDIYVVFVEKGLSLLNKNGLLGFILPHKFFNAQYGEALRGLITKGKHLSHVVHFGDQQVFEGATTYTCLMFLDKAGADKLTFEKVDDLDQWRRTGKATRGAIQAKAVTGGAWNFAIGDRATLLAKLGEFPSTLRDVADRIAQGIRTSDNDVYVLDVVRGAGSRGLLAAMSTSLGRKVSIEAALTMRFLQGREVKRYGLRPSGKVVLVPYGSKIGGLGLIAEDELRRKYAKAHSYLLANKARLEAREHGRMRGEGWHGYIYPKNIEVMHALKILVPDIADRASFALDETGEFAFTSGYGITLRPAVRESPKYVLGLLNSRLLDMYLKSVSTTMRGGFFRYFTQFVERLPIRRIDFSNKTDKARHDKMVELVTRMMELKKQQVRAPKKQSPSEKQLLDQKLAITDQQIDALVYELYGLTEEEIRIVEDRT